MSRLGPELLSTKDGYGYAKFNGRKLNFGRSDYPEARVRFAALKLRWEQNDRNLSDDMLPARMQPGVVTAMNALLAQKPELAPKIARAMDELRLTGLQTATDLESGFQRAFLRMRLEANDFAAVSDRAVTMFADRATDALVEFARTGQFGVRSFAKAVLDDATRIIARLLIVQAPSAIGGGTGIIPPVAGARADGGTVQPGRSYLVGERGPELFGPGRTGTVGPNAPAEPPTLENHTQVVVVADPNEVPAAIATGRADDQIIVAIQRNAGRIRHVIG